MNVDKGNPDINIRERTKGNNDDDISILREMRSKIMLIKNNKCLMFQEKEETMFP